jgi:cobalamin transport system substrate-binding protein
MNTMKRSLARPLGALLAVAALSFAAACSSSTSSSSGKSSSPSAAAASFPVTLGSPQITLSAQPKRIVSLSPTATEMLFAIGAGSDVVAVDTNSDYPATAPHTKIDAYQLNAEAVAGYKPDLVIEAGMTTEQVGKLRALHLPVLDEPAAATIDQSYQQIGELGTATGHSVAAQTLVTTMKQKISSIVAGTPKLPAGSSYYYELDQTYYSVTTSTFVGQVFTLLGLTSIADKAKGAAAAGGYPQLNGEYVLQANPSYVFLADTKCCKQSAATVAKRPGWSVLAAVRDGRIVPLDDDIASRWGPRIVELLQTVADAIRAHPIPS